MQVYVKEIYRELSRGHRHSEGLTIHSPCPFCTPLSLPEGPMEFKWQLDPYLFPRQPPQSEPMAVGIMIVMDQELFSWAALYLIG